MKHDHGKGRIKDNAIKALVNSKTYRAKVEEDKTKKIPRKQKHKMKPSSEGFLLTEQEVIDLREDFIQAMKKLLE